MKKLNNLKDYAVSEAIFEGFRIALDYIGDNYDAAYFHGITGTAFRIGGICPCAPTCTSAMDLGKCIELFGYDHEEIPFAEATADVDVEKMVEAVRKSIDSGVPALVWNAFTPCEWNVVTGYDENEKIFFGRAPWNGRTGDYAEKPWDAARGEAGLTGLLAVIIKGKTGALDRRQAEIAALKEAVRHANDSENADKIDSGEWVFLQGKAALKQWANDFSKPEKERGAGDSYCIDIYSSCHARAGEFLRGIAPEYPQAKDILLNSAQFFDKEAEYLEKLVPMLTWSSPGKDAERNAKAYPLLKEALENYSKAIDILESALALM